MKFLLLDDSDILSDYQRIWINGFSGGSIDLPKTECSACDAMLWWRYRLMPYQLPEDLEQELLSRDDEPIPQTELTILAVCRI